MHCAISDCNGILAGMVLQIYRIHPRLSWAELARETNEDLGSEQCQTPLLTLLVDGSILRHIWTSLHELVEWDFLLAITFRSLVNYREDRRSWKVLEGLEHSSIVDW